MPKVRWVVSDDFCSNFVHFPALQKFANRLRYIWQCYRQLTGGDFLRHSVVEPLLSITRGKIERQQSTSILSVGEWWYWTEARYCPILSAFCYHFRGLNAPCTVSSSDSYLSPSASLPAAANVIRVTNRRSLLSICVTLPPELTPCDSVHQPDRPGVSTADSPRLPHAVICYRFDLPLSFAIRHPFTLPLHSQIPPLWKSLFHQSQ